VPQEEKCAGFHSLEIAELVERGGRRGQRALSDRMGRYLGQKT